MTAALSLPPFRCWPLLFTKSRVATPSDGHMGWQVSESQAQRDYYKGYEGMNDVHSHVNYYRFNGLKYRIELAFDESRTAAGLMQYLKRLGIEPVVRQAIIDNFYILVMPLFIAELDIEKWTE